MFVQNFGRETRRKAAGNLEIGRDGRIYVRK